MIMNKRLSIIVLSILLSSGLLFGKTKVACVGNSITYGWALDRNQTYPSQLQNKLGTNYEVSNFGVSGRTLLKKGDKPYWNESTYQQALAFTPDIVIIMLGTNDSKSAIWDTYASEYTTDYSALIQSFRNVNTDIQVFTCTLPPSNNTGWDIRLDVINNEINPLILEVAKAQAVNLIDMSHAFQNKTGVMQSDGVHPNATGAELIADKIFSVLSSPKPQLTLTGNTLNVDAGYAFTWYKDNAVIEDENQQSLEIALPFPTNYQVLVQASQQTNDLRMSNSLNATEIVLSTKGEINSKFMVYFSAKQKGIQIQQNITNTKNTTFRLYNTRGQIIHENRISDTQSFISTPSLKSGVYIYQISNTSGHKSGSLIMP